jgi:drug/metabolite transporter (DMT)-like permease
VIVALSVCAALSWGAADFFGGLASRRASSLAVVVWSQAVGFVVLLAALGGVPGVLHATDLAWGAVCGIAGAIAIALLYRALAVGVMGVVSPLTAVLAAAVPVLFAFASGDRPHPLALAGIGCALVAVVLVSAAPATGEEAPLARVESPHRFAPGVPEALVAGLAFGFFFIGLARTHPDGGLYPLAAMRASSLVFLAGGALALRAPLRISRPGYRVVAAGGALDMLANVLYVFAVHGGALSIVAVLSSLYPAGTVALAGIVLGERLSALQWLGVGIALGGVTAIALAR